jgi:hypothetical protein
MAKNPYRMRLLSFPRTFIAAALSLAFTGTVAAAGPDAAAVVPEEFGALMEGQTEYLDVVVLGQRLGMFAVTVRPDTVSFEDPGAVLNALLGAGARLDDAARDTLLSVLTSHMSTHEALACSVAYGSCGYVVTDGADVILDRQKGELSLFLRSDWLARTPPDARLHLPTDGTENAFIHRQSALYASGRSFSSATVTGTGAVGLTEGGFAGFDWRLIRQDARQYRSTQWNLRSVYVRQDLARKYYVQAGRMDMRNLSSPLGGNFGLTMQPFPRLEGVRVGTTQAYVNREVAGRGSPVTVILTQPARVDAYRGEELLGSSYLQAGLQDVDTSAFPVGSYPVSLRIVQNGVVVRTEVSPFVREGGSASAITGVQWFAQAGRALYDDDDSLVRGHSRPQSMQAGFRVPLMRGLVAGNSLARVGDRLYDEARVDGWIPLGRHTITFSASQLVGNDGARGQMQQLSFGSRVSWSIYRYHTVTNHCDDTDNQRLRGLSCSTSISASVSTPVLRGQASLGYTRSTSRWRRPDIRQGNGLPLLPGDYSIADTEVASRALSVSYTRVFSLGSESLASVGVNGYRRDLSAGRSDRGGFLSLTLTRLPPRIPHHATRVQSLGAQFSTPTDGASRATLRVAETRIWQENGYRELGLQASGDDRQRLSASVNGRYDSSTGRYSVLLGEDKTRGGASVFSASGGYTSAFALSRSGFYLGADAGSNDPAAGVVISVEGNADTKGQLAASVSAPTMSPTSLRTGQKRLVAVDPFQKSVIDTRDAHTVSKTARVHASLETGTGPRSWFLTPGKLGRHVIASRLNITYVGRLSFPGDVVKSTPRILNAVHADMDEAGAFVAEFDHRPDVFYAWVQGDAYLCRPASTAFAYAITRVGEVPCESVPLAALPETIRHRLPAFNATALSSGVRTSVEGGL